MHRLILNAPKGLVVDHINGNGLDNRKANLRLCTPAQNACNVRPRPGETSKYKGVAFIKRERRWQVRISFRNKRKWIGYFDTEIDAARAYDQAARRLHKEFASLNFPDRP